MGVQNEVKNEGMAFENALLRKKKTHEDLVMESQKDYIHRKIDETVDEFMRTTATVSSDK